MKRKWKAPVYAFFEPDQGIEFIDGRTVHVFKCANTGCRHLVRRYLTSRDKTSTNNLRKHVRKCWGVEALEAADQTSTMANAKDCVERYRRTGNLKVAFGAAGKKTFRYSTIQHSPTETR